jgi:hypothetical protein
MIPRHHTRGLWRQLHPELLGQPITVHSELTNRLRPNTDCSYLPRTGALSVRIITAEITVTGADGTRYTASYRLATTLVDPRRHPAKALIGLYHERWEHEIA